ncbi:UDP-N-acetylglucosamine--N-acetylmuramyl-(pentapeptide) pyrophosphoryl-undecaprenol N-acetylglucosamine transferase [uncultured archaeon]|nr:UDP-N-acetylglucosamine--N-acetylmuramyl-(pentapeptide) pyrophosphoryl-undecaprenol N-acetylglucosamine transferase [uncultured archaeon]
MILVIVGLMYGFNRLLIAVDDIAEKMEEEIMMQIGESSYIPKNAKYFRYTSEENINELYRQSRIVICHAGVGSIMNALEYGKPVIVVPRRKELGEHFDDHQLEIANELSRSGMIHIANDIDTLRNSILEINEKSVEINKTNNSLTNQLKIYIQSLNK